MPSEGLRLTVHNQTRQTVLGTQVQIADTFSSRLIGLLGKRGLANGSGLLIHPSCAVHTIGMMFPIDVLFLDAQKKVVGMSHVLKPFCLTRIYRHAECVLELPASTIRNSNTQLGDAISFEV